MSYELKKQKSLWKVFLKNLKKGRHNPFNRKKSKVNNVPANMDNTSLIIEPKLSDFNQPASPLESKIGQLYKALANQEKKIQILEENALKVS